MRHRADIHHVTGPHYESVGVCALVGFQVEDTRRRRDRTRGPQFQRGGGKLVVRSEVADEGDRPAAGARVGRSRCRADPHDRRFDGVEFGVRQGKAAAGTRPQVDRRGAGVGRQLDFRCPARRLNHACQCNAVGGNGDVA